ncbi:MAG TPA: hypothetical protein VME01_01180 [Solirubrobacteraceae bacterium]|nr:hypothetical protein [Solirubrobacteraceae bacterium]
MRRIILACAALLCLACAGVATAATVGGTSSNNGYMANFKFSGGAKKNVGITMTESLGSTPPTGFGRPYPLADILTTLYGVSAPYAKYFPKCTVAMINDAGGSGKWNSICPKGSLVAKGTVGSSLGDSTANDPTLSNAGNPCNLSLWVYNAGPGKLAYFFTVSSSTACMGLNTGAAAAYPGTAVEKGHSLVNNVPEEADISFNAGGAGLWGPLLTETLTWNGKVKVKGKTYSYLVSTGCKGKSRPWSVSYTGTDYTGTNAAPTSDVTTNLLTPVTVSGKASC